MLDFLTPTLFDGLIWTIIVVGGIWAVVQIARNLSGPPRWPIDDNPLEDSDSTQAP